MCVLCVYAFWLGYVCVCFCFLFFFVGGGEGEGYLPIQSNHQVSHSSLTWSSVNSPILAVSVSTAASICSGSACTCVSEAAIVYNYNRIKQQLKGQKLEPTEMGKFWVGFGFNASAAAALAPEEFFQKIN